MKTFRLLIVSQLLVLALAGTAFGSAIESRSYAAGTLSKLGRGIVNVATSPGELMRQYYLTKKQEGNLAGLSSGIVKGIGWTIGRALSGVYDIVTFPIPAPANFEPLMKPDFVYVDGEWSP